MTRWDLLVCIVISGVAAGCNRSPAAPTGVELLAAGRVSMTFTAQDETPAFATAAEAYRRLWVDEGPAS